MRFGVEPICVQLTELGCSFAPSTYYEARNRPPSRRALRDVTLTELIRSEHAKNYCAYGARKMWMHLRRKDVDVGRCRVERLMREAGLHGARRGKKKRTTHPDPAAARAGDLVGRDFAPLAPNLLWVADFTYVWTMAGWVYVAFVVDAYARRILGWNVTTTMRTDLVLDALNQAAFTRRKEGNHDFDALVHHNDAGSQYTSIRFTKSLAEHGISPSIGTVGDAHDNALAESINGLYKAELIEPGKPWRSAWHVEKETAAWVRWFNHDRLYEYCGDIPPVELEQHYFSCINQRLEVA